MAFFREVEIKAIACDFLRLDPTQDGLNGLGEALSMSQLVSRGETAAPTSCRIGFAKRAQPWSRQPRLRAVPWLASAALRWS
jgi:hypothetical protein